MLARVLQNVPNIQHVIEAGAHNGSDSIRLAKAFPHATVHSFECHPVHYEALKNRIEEERRIKAYPQALAPTNGSIRFHLSSGASDASSSILQPQDHEIVHPNVIFDQEMVVEGVTLDSWLASNPSIEIDFAWLDMQGAEHAVLEASPNALKQLRAIYTEVSFQPMFKGAPLYPDFCRMLQQHGFALALEDKRWDDMGNALFLKSS